MGDKTEFISVEVAIKTDHPSEELIQWFTEKGEDVTALPWDTHRSYIYFAPLPCGTPDETIRYLCGQISCLTGVPRQQWEAASFREFYIGYRIGDGTTCHEEHLSFETLTAVTSVGAGIGYALYPNRKPEE